MNIENLRKKLDEVIKIKSPSENIEYIDNLRKEIPHKIKLIEVSNFSNNFYPNYNCYMYAFNLVGSKEVDQKAQATLGRIRPGNGLAAYLLKQKILKEIKFKEAIDGDIIIYSENAKPIHAGKTNSGRVISKWGLEGHLWEHDIDEVPLRFGPKMKFYSNISKELTLNSFFNYAKIESERIENRISSIPQNF